MIYRQGSRCCRSLLHVLHLMYFLGIAILNIPFSTLHVQNYSSVEGRVNFRSQKNFNVYVLNPLAPPITAHINDNKWVNTGMCVTTDLSCHCSTV
jgi:hypothetical protein